MNNDKSNNNISNNKIKSTNNSFFSFFNKMEIPACIYEIVYNKKNINYRIIDLNQKYENEFKLKKSSIIGKLVTEISNNNEIPLPELFNKVLTTKTSGKFDYFLPEVNKFYSLSIFSPIKNYIAVIFNDITKYKKAEEDIKSAKALIDTVFELSPFAMWISDKEGTIIRTNNSLCKTINLDKNKIIGKYNVLKDINLELQGVMPKVKSVFENHKTTHFIIPWKATDSGTNSFNEARDMFIDVTMFPILHQNGELMNVVCQWVDITEHKWSEKILQKAFNEKKDLLKELQHRVKNSFVMLLSMINLLNNPERSDEAKYILNEIISRISAVSELYELLYTTDSIYKVRLDEYLKRIANSLPVIAINISFEIDCDIVVIEVKKAMPIGLIVTELITNSIKYAFPEHKAGKIFITLKKLDNKIFLEVKDNGIGLTEEVDVSNSDSFGMKIIHALTSQIDADISIINNNGTSCTIEIPVKQEQ